MKNIDEDVTAIKFHSGAYKKVYSNEYGVYKKKEPELTEAEFIKKRKGIVTRVKDFRKGQTQKGNWRKNRWRIMKGINQYHRSTTGKKFHKKLGRFLALRDLRCLSYGERHELLQPMFSAIQHSFLELDYYHPVDETVEVELFVDYLYDEFFELQRKFKKYDTNFSKFEELLLRITEESELVKGLAKVFGKTETSVRAIWDKSKKSALKKYKQDEDAEGFMAYVFGMTKKLLVEKAENDS